MLHINDLVFRFGDRQLFDSATLHIPSGRKVGLVGRNGTGKSTLVSMILGERGFESGSISLNPGARIGHVAQEAPGDDKTLIETVVAADTRLVTLRHQADTEQDPMRIADIHTQLADIDAHTAEARAATLLAGLGFDEAAQSRPCGSFSGGWRMRVALACTLFLKPDLLLLDEPTNYLDLEGVMWLESYLQSYPYTVFLISHDRDLLNKAVTHIVHLTEGKFTTYAGGYDDFEAARREAQSRQMALKSRQEAERRRLEAFVDRFRYKASKAKQAQSRVKMLEKMKPIASVIDDHTVPFSFPKPDPLSSPLIALEDASAGYGDKTVLRDLNLRIDMDDRIALLGANGNGKSTFAKVLARKLGLMTGKLRTPRKLVTAYFAQHQQDELNGAESPLQHLEALMPDATEAKVRARLGQFGFGIEKADRPVSSLSGGEKARLLMALASFEAPHILILDEPTNHLDVDSRAALADAINSYDGAIILISHDRHLVHMCADRLWIVQDGSVAPYGEDLDSYRQSLLSVKRQAGLRQDSAPDRRREARQKSADRRAERAPLRKKIADYEAEIQRLEALRDRAQQILSDPRIYEPENKEKLLDINAKNAKIEASLERFEQRWLDASAALDVLMSDD